MALAGSEIFGRKVRILVAKPTKDLGSQLVGVVTDIDGEFHVQFKVEKTLGKGPNSAHVVVHNLGETVRGNLQDKGSFLVVQAGYEDSISTIFKGNVRTFDHQHPSVDWITKIAGGDGERSYCFATCAENFPPGVKLHQVCTRLGETFGLELPDFSKVEGMDRQFDNGYAAIGSTTSNMDRLLIATGYEWSIQDMRLRVAKKGAAAQQTEQVIVLSSENGLIGSPEYCEPEKKSKPPILKFKSFLFPQLAPGGLVSFASLRHQGIHRIKKIEHTGDTEAQPWYTEGEVEVAVAAQPAL